MEMVVNPCFDLMDTPLKMDTSVSIFLCIDEMRCAVHGSSPKAVVL